MTSAEFIEITREGIYILLLLGAPPLIVALIVGLAISLLQALTQIQEATLTFVPKIVAMLLTLVIVLPFMTSTLIEFAERLAQRIENVE